MGIEQISAKDMEVAVAGTNKLTEHAKVDDIVNYIQKYTESKKGKKLRERFNAFSKEDQMRLYKDGGLNFGKYMKMSLAMGTIARVQAVSTYTDKRLKATGPELSIIYRFLVHMGVLDNPGIPKEELFKNVKKDAKFIQAFLTVVQGVCTVAAPEAIELISALKTVAKTVSDKAVEIATKQIESQESVEEVEVETKHELEDNLKGIEKTAA